MHRLILLVLAAAALLGLLLVLRRRSARRPPEAVEPAEPAALPETPETVESPRAAEATEAEAEPVAPLEEEPVQAPAVTGTAAEPDEAVAVPLPQGEPGAADRTPEPAFAETMEPVAPAETAPAEATAPPVAPEPVAADTPPGPAESGPAACAARLHRLEQQLRARLDEAVADGDDPQRDRLQRALVLLNDRLVHLADSCRDEADCRIQALALLDELAGDGADTTAAAAARALRTDDPGPAEALFAALGEGADPVAGRAALLGGRLADGRVDLERALAL